MYLGPGGSKLHIPWCPGARKAFVRHIVRNRLQMSECETVDVSADTEDGQRSREERKQSVGNLLVSSPLLSCLPPFALTFLLHILPFNVSLGLTGTTYKYYRSHLSSVISTASLMTQTSSL